MNILIIEDDIFWQVKLKMMLEELGHNNTHLVGTINEAADIIPGLKPDLIISDVMLHENIIFDLFKIQNLKNTPFIFITTSESTLHYDLSKQIPNASYLIKPFHTITLASAIDKVRSAKTEEDGFGVTVRGPQNEIIFIKTDNIVWVKAELNYCILKTLNNQFVIKKSLIKVLQELGQQMMQIHRSIIVNKKLITKVNAQKGEVSTHLGVLPIGRQYRQNVLIYVADSTKL